MSSFNPNIPNPGDLLSDSQPVLKTNNQALNNIFGIDHYPFADVSLNQGFHNQVTTPAFSTGTEPSTSTNPIIFARQQTAPLGVLQYSKGPTNAIKCPITNLQSPGTAIVLIGGNVTNSNILDFTGLNRAFVVLTVSNYQAGLRDQQIFYISFFNGVGFIFTSIAPVNSTGFRINNTLNIVRISNNNPSTYTQVFWTLQLLRLET